jgi:hypothetical protein
MNALDDSQKSSIISSEIVIFMKTQPNGALSISVLRNRILIQSVDADPEMLCNGSLHEP